MADSTSYRNSPRARRSPIWKLPDDGFRALVARSVTYTAVLAHFGLQNRGGNWRGVIARITALEIDTSHFQSKHAASMALITLTPEQVLIEDSPHSGATARRKFRQVAAILYECKECGQEPSWHGKPLVLVLDHRNGRNRDHRPENLRWLCPNCNSQADTFAGRRRREIR